MKNYHFFPQDSANFEEALKKLPALIEEYNNRPTKPLLGLTPNEALEQGKLVTGMFKERLKQAMQLRIQENKTKLCGVC